MDLLFSLLEVHHCMGNKASMPCTGTSSNSSQCQLPSVIIGLIDCMVVTAVRFLTVALVSTVAELNEGIPPPNFYCRLNMLYKALM